MPPLDQVQQQEVYIQHQKHKQCQTSFQAFPALLHLHLMTSLLLDELHQRQVYGSAYCGL